MMKLIQYTQQNQILNSIKMKNNEDNVNLYSNNVSENINYLKNMFNGNKITDKIKNEHIDTNDINIQINDEPIKNEAFSIIKPLTNEMENNITTGEQSIPIIDFIKVDDEKHILGDGQYFENINKDLNVDKIEFMNNCLQHTNKIENTNIIFSHADENYHSFVKLIIKKLHTNEFIQESDLYTHIGNTIIFSLLNINSECVKDAIHLFSETYNFNINNQIISESKLLDTNSLEETKTITENISNKNNEITKIRIEEQKSFMAQYRNKIIYTAAVSGSIFVLGKFGVPAYYAYTASQVAKETVKDIDISAFIPSRITDKEDANNFFKIIMSWFH